MSVALNDPRAIPERKTELLFRVVTYRSTKPPILLPALVRGWDSYNGSNWYVLEKADMVIILMICLFASLVFNGTSAQEGY